ncbi:hypothetical protein C4D60_Mb03t20430 [Musa balbisiana]|uniref:Importin N-terminal domain-containing protein n=1 Tax=Musa balbisiana TaxID=52838 RepID=A0A4S8JBM3_MUSBA|nr:hypothetical protein C4D60_Mb03t20430 [Musa balbisiana]
MDLASLTVVLRAALSPIPEERKAAEESLNQFQYTPKHLVRLLQIIVDGTYDMGVRQVASIHFKNFVAKHWSPHDPGEPQKVSEIDKSMVRENILGFIVQVPPLLRFKSDEERTPLYLIVEETFPLLLDVFNKLVHIVNPPIEVADLIKLICKIFWSSIYLEIPRQLFDPNVFGSWMVLFLNILERPVPLEGQPSDPEARKSWGWWKVKKWTIHILNRLYTRFGDLKLQKPESKAFAQMFQKNYAGRILGCYLQLLNEIRIGGYLPDRVTNLILQYLGNRYDGASVEFKPYRQKDGALLAIGALCDKLKQTEPYKSELERMLVQHVLPEFTSPIGHLRAKAAWVAGQYAHINFSDQNNFRRVFHYVVSGLQDPELPVRVDSVFALRSFVEACKDLNEIRPILPQLLDEFFKLMNEVENEDLVFTLETIVDKFGEEMAPYAIGLCQNLAAAFWRCLGASESDDEADDSGALAAVGCLRAISTILESVNRLPHLFVQIEPTLLPIMRKMLSTDGQDVFEEVLEIVSYMTFYSPTISLEMWTLWPLIMDALGDWAIDFFDNILGPLDNYISRSTSHFLTCKDPDYQQSLWNALSSMLSDKNIDDADIEPAPKLIEVVFQNCKGQVDHWVEPYLRITIERLQRAERPYLKCLLMLVIADALYYNPSLTLNILHKLGVAAHFFNLWFQMLQEVKRSGTRANFKREHDKKVCCLGLISLLGLPADQLPGEAFERVFKATLELLVSYKDQARAFQSNYEDDDSDDDYSDDEVLQSPIDEVDPFIFFIDTVQAVQASNPIRFQNLTQTLDFRYQAMASGIAHHAEQRRAEIEKEKLEQTVTK